MVKGKFNFCSTVDRQVLISNVSTFSIDNRWLIVLTPRELNFIFPFCYFFPWLGLKGRTLRVFQFGLSPFNGLFAVIFKTRNIALIQDSGETITILRRFHDCLETIENDRFFSLKYLVWH